ncbi:MAG: carboxymuconolactone decarboxylase family protein [Chloroflexi bacterium]|nr:carboxymuconolactone decarboxylase family protein [Chloroflexota bacterium]
MSTEEARAFLQRTQQERGYTLEMHRILAEADLEWAVKYNEFIEATYTGQRLLDRKTKELLQIVVEAALRADVEQIQAHVKVALREGATPREILEALQTVIAPMGALAFRRGVQAWAAETGFQTDDAG